MVDKLSNTWTLVESQNFDDYMKKLGVGFALRKVGNLTKPTQVISFDGDRVTIKTISTFRTTEMTAQLGEEFDEITLDDRHTKSTLVMDGNKLVHTQRWDGKVTTLVREVKNDKMVMTCTFEGVIAVRVYESR